MVQKHYTLPRGKTALVASLCVPVCVSFLYGLCSFVFGGGLLAIMVMGFWGNRTDVKLREKEQMVYSNLLDLRCYQFLVGIGRPGYSCKIHWWYRAIHLS